MKEWNWILIVYILILIIGFAIIFSSRAQTNDTTSTIILKFSETMNIDGLLNAANYKIKDQDTTNHKNYRIYKIGIVKKIDGVVSNDTSQVGLITERLPYRKTFIVTASNVKDRAGNFIDPQHKTAFLFFNGYTPGKFVIPVVGIKK